MKNHLILGLALVVSMSFSLSCSRVRKPEPKTEASAQQQQPARVAGKKLALEDIFLSGKLSGKSLAGLQWLPDGSGYTYLAANPQTGRYDIKRVDNINGAETTLIAGSELVLEGSDSPIDIDYYELSPDRTSVLFTSTLESRGTKTGGDFHLFDLKTRKLRALAKDKGDQRIIQLSPDGTKIGFVRASNLFVLELATGKETQLTFDGSETVLNGHFDWVYEEEFGIINGWQWSPDSKAIAFWRLDQSGVSTYALPDYRSPTLEPKRMYFPKPGEANSLVKVGIARAEGGHTAWVDLGQETDIYVPRIQWLPDSSRLSLQRMNRAQNQNELLLADPETGVTKIILTEKSDTWVDVNTMVYFFKTSPDFLWSSDRDGFTHLYRYGLDGSLRAQVTSGKWEVRQLHAVDEIQNRVFFTGSKDSAAENHVYGVSLASGDITRLSEANYDHSATFSPDGSFFMDDYSNLMTPARVGLRNTEGSLVRMINENPVPELGEYALAKPEFFQFTTDDGATLDGYWMLPADFDPSRKYPVLIYVYGGPWGATVNNVWGGSRGLWHQYMTQQGYIVASVDGRGTPGRGREHLKSIYKRFGILEPRDQISAAKHLSKFPWVDSTRIGIWGWSNGGYVTALSVAQGGNAFKAGVAVAGGFYWEMYDTIYTERYMSTPQLNPEGYKQSSVATYIDGMTGSLLMVHGLDDDNVHFQHSVVFDKELLDKNKKVELLVYPFAKHGIYEGRYYRFNLFGKITEYLLKHL